MKTQASNYAVLFVLSLLFLAGCTRLSNDYQNYIILYNLNDPQKIEVRIPNIYEYSGRIKDKLPDGTTIDGNFIFNQYLQAQNNYTPPNYRVLSAEELLSKEVGPGNSSARSVKKVDREQVKQNFPELFGYSTNVQVTPIGNATLMIGKSRMIEIVFYSINKIDDSGAGIGKDNDGNIYRVYLVTETSVPH